MSSPAYVEQLLSQPGTGKVFYRDKIMDAGFVGHFDFLSDYVRDGLAPGVAAPALKTLKNLTGNGAVATVTTAIPAGFSSRGLVMSDNAGTLRLPDTFAFGTTETHFAIGISLRFDPTFVYPVSSNVSIAGYAYQTGSECQWLFNHATDASGVPITPRFYADGAFVNLPSAAFLTDGKQHFLWGEFEVLAGGTNKRLTVYLDGVQVVQATSAYDGALNQVVNAFSLARGPVIGTAGGFSNQVRGSVGRTSAKRFAADPDAVSIATISAAEYAAYSTRYGV